MYDYSRKFPDAFKAHIPKLNADMCLFLEDWAAMSKSNPEKYDEWKDKISAYYSRLKVSAKSKTETEDNAITRKIVPSIGLQDL